MQYFTTNQRYWYRFCSFESENEVVWYFTMDPHLQFPAVFFLFMKMFEMFFVLWFQLEWVFTSNEMFSAQSPLYLLKKASQVGFALRWCRGKDRVTHFRGEYYQDPSRKATASLLNVSRFRPVIVVVTSDNFPLKVIWDSTGSAPSLWNLADALKQSCALPLR